MASTPSCKDAILGIRSRRCSRKHSPTSCINWLRIPLMADSDSIPIADSVPGDGGHVARVS
ncbi:hypothetical protein F7Q92_15780 [Ideonella dechloratans]|uniref:Uncharacterized protein n=1 Tax=Ideonella dechloratans TaxID=36863 RepID=A0A643F941_IDEDE|nr:hypothetical protein F7Q92_15780 [Ideonella dechloratans]